MDAANYVRHCTDCHAPLAWLDAKCPSCAHEFSAAEMAGAHFLLEKVADNIELRYTPGTPENAAFVEEMDELDRFLEGREAAKTGSVVTLVESKRVTPGEPRVQAA